MKKKIVLNTHYTCRRNHLKTGAEEKAIPGTDIYSVYKISGLCYFSYDQGLGQELQRPNRQT